MIVIDGNEANVEQRVGSNVYAYQLLKGLAGLSDHTECRVFLKSNPLDDLPTESHRWQYHSFGPSPLWTQWRLPLELYRTNPKPRLIFTPGHYAPRFSPIPSVISILDLSFLYFPQAFTPKVLRQLKNWTHYSAKQAAHILTISKASKADIVKEYGIAPEKITVTYLGSNLPTNKKITPEEINNTKHKYGISTKYFLFVGTRQPKKNLERLIKAFNKLQSTERNISLVIVGKTWHQFAKPQLEGGPNIIYTGYVPEEDINSLMLGAESFVFPSLYEGFGIPVLEAMSLGVPVAASNVSSIPEITGDSPLLFDPYNEGDITKALQHSLHLSTDKRKKIIREGKIRAKQFSWDKCVAQTKAVLDQI